MCNTNNPPTPTIIEWGPTIYKKEFAGRSKSNVIHDALVWVSESHVRIRDSQIGETPRYPFRLSIYYVEDERIEDYNGEPCWLSEL